MDHFKEQFRLTLSDAGKIRNRAEKHLVEYAQELLAKPVAINIEHIWEELQQQREAMEEDHPAWGTCRLSDIHTNCRVVGAQRVMRGFGIYGRGRGVFTLAISETVEKDAANGFAPYQRPGCVSSATVEQRGPQTS